MHPLAGERIQIRGQRRGERLALPGAHLGNLAGMQHHAAHKLHVKVPHRQGAFGSLPHDRKRFGQQIIERLTVRHALAKLARLRLYLFIRKRR